MKNAVGDYNRKILDGADILNDTHNLNRMSLALCTPEQAHSYVHALEIAEVHGVTCPYQILLLRRLLQRGGRGGLSGHRRWAAG
jgi:hypothetical protein